MKLVVFDTKIVQIGQEFAEIEPFWCWKWAPQIVQLQGGALKNAIFLKIGSKIHENAKNDLEIPYKYISDHLWPLGSGLEVFLYDFEKSIFGLTSPPSPPGGHKPSLEPIQMSVSAPKWLYLGKFLADLDDLGVKSI